MKRGPLRFAGPRCYILVPGRRHMPLEAIGWWGIWGGKFCATQPSPSLSEVNKRSHESAINSHAQRRMHVRHSPILTRVTIMADSDADSIITNLFAPTTTKEDLQKRVERYKNRLPRAFWTPDDWDEYDRKKRRLERLARDLGPRKKGLGLRRDKDGRIKGSRRITPSKGHKDKR